MNYPLRPSSGVIRDLYVADATSTCTRLRHKAKGLKQRLMTEIANKYKATNKKEIGSML